MLTASARFCNFHYGKLNGKRFVATDTYRRETGSPQVNRKGSLEIV